MLDESLKEMRDKMDKTVDVMSKEFSNVRTGRANAGLLDGIKVSYYGGEVPLQQIASVSVVEGRSLEIKPYDSSALAEIEKAIFQANLGLTPQNDGKLVRLSFPPLTEERRKELVKVVRHKAEEGRVAVRNLRRAGRHELEALQKDGDLSTDELERVEKDLEKITHDQVALIDQLLASKEQELLQV
jgi:ribosome recycling factor